MKDSVMMLVKIGWNDATQQWRVKNGLTGSHLQEWNETDTEKDIYSCETVDKLVERLGLVKENNVDTLVVVEMRRYHVKPKTSEV